MTEVGATPAAVEAATWPLRCTNCGEAAGPGSPAYACGVCGGLFDLSGPLRAPQSPKAARGGLGLLPDEFSPSASTEWITLGEGNTPLIAADVDGRPLHFKCEYLNPTGSFKDRGSSVLVSVLAASGVTSALEDSSGNAGASFAAYAARAGIRARLLVPEGASPRKLAQIAAYGAEVVRVPGPRSAAAERARQEAAGGQVYASHVWLPFGLAGFALMAFELVDQLGEVPAAVVLPVGHGTLLLGLARGFAAMAAAGLVDRAPKWIAAQAAACAPLWAVYQGGGQAVGWVQEGETRAEGIRILRPLRGDAVLQAIESSGGTIVAVDEPSIRRGEIELARRGFFVEPTSAVVWSALESTARGLGEPVVAILTGSGLKSEPPGPVGREHD